MVKVYSIRANARIMSVVTEIRELEKNEDTTRTAIFERAVLAAKTEQDWNAVYNTEIDEIPGIEVPESFQVKADEADMNMLCKTIQTNVEEIHKLHTVVAIRLILSSYLIKLRKKAANVGAGKNESSRKDISGPEMVAILVDMLMKDRSVDADLIEDIKDKLIDWRESIYRE